MMFVLKAYPTTIQDEGLWTLYQQYRGILI